jgi:hypothetical protein
LPTKIKLLHPRRQLDGLSPNVDGKGLLVGGGNQEFTSGPLRTLSWGQAQNPKLMDYMLKTLSSKSNFLKVGLNKPVIPPLGRLRQEQQDFKASLGSIVRPFVQKPKNIRGRCTESRTHQSLGSSGDVVL